jgi:LPS sulfotransferase NodH
LGERSGYVITAEPRSGSQYLCRLLESTGVLGRPREVFGQAEARQRLWRDPRGGLLEMIGEASTANGIYGFKIFSHHLDIMGSTAWLSRLPSPRFVRLTRGDLLGQAISYVRAQQTKAYSAGRPIRGEPRYDAGAITTTLARLAQQDARWRAYVARNGLAPLELSYEEVVAAPQATVASVAALLGVDGAQAELAQVTVEMQRDALSETWRARFLAEERDLDWLDGWPWPKAHARWRQLRAQWQTRRAR